MDEYERQLIPDARTGAALARVRRWALASAVAAVLTAAWPSAAAASTNFHVLH